MAFYHLLTNFVDIPQGSPGRIILDGDGITTVSTFVQVPDQYFMDMRHDVTTTDDAGVDTMQNQLLQYVKCISLTWLKCYLFYLMNEDSMGELSVDKLNGIETTKFNYFRGSFTEMPKLVLTKIPSSAHPNLADISLAVKCQEIIKDESTQPFLLEDISYINKIDVDPMVLTCAHDNPEVIGSEYMLSPLDEEKSFIDQKNSVVSMSDHNTKSDDGIILVRKHDREYNAQEYFGQIQAEVLLTKAAYEHSKAVFNDVYNITTEDLAPDISTLEISELAVREVNSNNADKTGYEDGDDRKILACITKYKVLTP